MRVTALGFATEYAAAIKTSGDETMSAQDIVQMAGVFLSFLADRDGAEPALASVDTTQPDSVADPASEPAQPTPDQPTPSAQPIEPPPAAPPPPPEAPVPEQPAPAA